MGLWPQSIRWRLTLWYSLTLAVILIAFAAGSFAVLQHVLSRRGDRFLEEARDAFVTELAIEAAAAPSIEQAVRAAERDVRFGEIRFLVFDDTLAPIPSGQGASSDVAPTHDDTPWAVDPSALRPSLDSARAGGADLPVAIITHSGGTHGYRAALRSTTLRRRPYHVVALQSRAPLQGTLKSAAFVFGLAVPLCLIVAAGGGYVLAKRALRPVAAMSRRAREISARTLDQRLPVTNPRDEIGGLATMINDLLDRLERSFEQQRQFLADASHELRTPVAIIRGEADVTLDRASRTDAEYRDSLRVIQDAGNRLSTIVEDLFLLARADNHELSVAREPLYLDELVADAVRSVRSIAARHDVVVTLEPVTEIPYRGDANLLGRLLLNLLDNAITYSRAGSEVRVRLVDSGEWCDVLVADTGPGVPTNEQERIFTRFYRGDKARSRSIATRTGGAGLGLAIGRWIAEAHGGSLDLVRSDEGGSEFRVRLPRNSTAAASDLSSFETGEPGARARSVR